MKMGVMRRVSVAAQAVVGGRKDDYMSQSSLKPSIYRNCEISVQGGTSESVRRNECACIKTTAKS